MVISILEALMNSKNTLASPKFCRDCVYSKPEERSDWNLRCHNPLVAVKDSWNLSSLKVNGTECRAERDLPWYKFPACGKSGKLYAKILT